MSKNFVKLFSSITESTVWCEPHATRIVWITMLAMADSRGRVSASVPGLANRARVSIEECEQALQRFQEPDSYSRTIDHDGRRIERIDGGWRLLNYSKYRDLRDDESRREYQRNWDRENRVRPSDDPTANPTNPTNPTNSRPSPTQEEVEVEEEKRGKPRAGRATRLPADWKPDPAGVEFCRSRRPDLDLDVTVERFRDYWVAKAGKDGLKLCWSATWRNWVRNERRVVPTGRQAALEASNAKAGDRWLRGHGSDDAAA